MRILILCTGNSCRSQMAQGFLRSFDPRLEVHSAGTEPAGRVNPYAVEVMREAGIDISAEKPRSVAEFADQPFDYVITVCAGAEQNCPVFTGKVGQRLHIGFEDPAQAAGAEERLLRVFRESRDEIGKRFREFYQAKLRPQLDAAAVR